MTVSIGSRTFLLDDQSPRAVISPKPTYHPAILRSRIKEVDIARVPFLTVLCTDANLVEKNAVLVFENTEVAKDCELDQIHKRHALLQMNEGQALKLASMLSTPMLLVSKLENDGRLIGRYDGIEPYTL